MFGGVATGVIYAADAEKPIANTTAVGLAPKDSAMDKPIGHSSAAAAVLDMNWVNRPVITNSTAVSTIGFGDPPIMSTTWSAKILPAPVDYIAVARPKAPANRKMVCQSKDW